MRNSILLILILMLLPSIQGCYLAKQGWGQLNIRLNHIPLEEAAELASEEQFKTLLDAVPDVKEFAITRLGLKRSQNYTSYYATPKPAITFVVTACKKTDLIPYTWWFPVVGSVPYKGFFEKADALALEQALQSQGYDTWVFGAVAYSTLGWFKDPITTPMLKRGYFNLVETIIHEMTHETLFIKGNGSFNEQLASFVGKTGAYSYFSELNILDDEALEKVKEKQTRKKRFSLAIKNTIPRLEMLYSSDKSFDQIMKEREKIFADLSDTANMIYPQPPNSSWKFNNARILQFRRYESEPEILKKIWHDSQQQWDRFWAKIRRYAKEKYNYTS